MICMAKLLLISKATMFLFMSLRSLKNSIKKSCGGLNDYYYNLPVQVSLEQGMSQYSRIKSSLKSTLWYLLRLTPPDIWSLSLFFFYCTRRFWILLKNWPQIYKSWSIYWILIIWCKNARLLLRRINTLSFNTTIKVGCPWGKLKFINLVWTFKE